MCNFGNVLLWLIFALPTRKKVHKQHEIYMASAGPSRWGSNATYISLGFCVGGNANLMFYVGGNASFSDFRYQHVGIPNAKFSRWGCYPTPDPT